MLGTGGSKVLWKAIATLGMFSDAAEVDELTEFGDQKVPHKFSRTDSVAKDPEKGAPSEDTPLLG